jgi:uncharacterized protein (DUF58 family)
MSPWIDRFFRPGRTFIVPNGAGLSFALLFFSLLFLGAALNRPLLQLVGLMISIPYLSGMVQSNSNLKDISLRIREDPLGQAGRPLSAKVILEHPGKDPLRGIRLVLKETSAPTQAVWIERIEAGGSMEVELPIGEWSRGKHPFPMIEASSAFPLGLFRTWKRFEPDGRVWAYPEPGGNLPWTDASKDSDPTGPEYLEHREALPDDPMRRIDWKRFARDRKKMVRLFQDQSEEELLIRWDDLNPLPLEARLSQFTRWVFLALRTGRQIRIDSPFHSGLLNGGASLDPLLKSLAAFPEEP